MDTEIDAMCAQFAAALDIFDAVNRGDFSAETIKSWYEITIREYTAEELLLSMSRHVKALAEADANQHHQLFTFHMEKLEAICDEIERRLQVR